MFVTVTYRGRPLTLDLEECVEQIDCTTSKRCKELQEIRHLRGRIVAGVPKGLEPGQEVRVRTRQLRCRLILLTGDGEVRSTGFYHAPCLDQRSSTAVTASAAS